ncbi:hypothetical protein [Phascolarctobacterium succinatutens]
MEMKQVYEALEKVENGADHPLFLFLCFITSDHMLFPIVSIQQLHAET